MAEKHLRDSGGLRLGETLGLVPSDIDSSRMMIRIWALDLERRVGHNKAAVALANELARLAWSVWKNDRAFESLPKAA